MVLLGEDRPPLELTSFVIDVYNKQLQTDVICTDFRNALGSVKHSFLFFILDQLWFLNNLLAWTSS